MSDDLVKALLESLTPEQKSNLIDQLLSSNAKSDAPERQEDVAPPEPQSNITEDFKVIKQNDLDQRKTPVRGRKNQWVDTGEDRDPDFDPEKFERMGKTARNRGRAKKVQVECHVCGKNFHINENLIYGEFTRCNRCTGR